MNVRHFDQTLRRHGATALLREIAKLAAAKAVPFRIVRATRLTYATLDRSFLVAPAELACGFLDDAALARFSADPSNDLPIDFVRAARAKGDRCYGIVANGELASYGWYSRRPTAMGDGLTFCFDPSYAYMYKGFTKPTFRGRRLYPIGMARAMEALVAEGAEGLVAYVDSTNFASLKSCRRTGHEELGTLIAIQIGGLWTTFATGRASELGIRLVADRPKPRPIAGAIVNA